MWTPKRVLLLSAGIAVFVAGYFVYGFFFGSIDGMPPLPQEFFGAADGPSPLPPLPETDIDKKLTLAFGKDCVQLKNRMKFEVSKKNMVIACEDIKTNEPDGRVKIEDFSVAIFKELPKGNGPEINTITSDHAYLTFDIPIKDPTDIQKGNLIAGELCTLAEGGKGGINIINNRGTPCPETNDDLVVLIKKGPLFYDALTAKIWTDDFVQLLDLKTKPHPTKITGLGMDMLLTKDNAKEKKQHAPAAKSKVKNDLSGVEMVTLKSRVEMHLYPGADSGFMAGPATPGKNAKKDAPDMSEITITTEGPFDYDVPNDVAHFTSPSGNNSLDQVKVVRRMLRNEDLNVFDVECDQLLCDFLTLKFSREAAAPSKPGDTQQLGSQRQIETARATARKGQVVTVAMDSENLDCECLELNYQCPTPERGARTVLRGEPLKACKAGSKIVTKEMTLVSKNQKGEGQQMVAQGPGVVDLFDQKTKAYTTHAIYKGLLTQRNYKEGDRDLDQLTLTIDASFVEDDTLGPDGCVIKAGQKLHGQKLQVYLAPKEPPSNATPAQSKAEDGDSGPRQKPVKVEAFDLVSAELADMRITHCDRLTIRFNDVPPETVVLPPPNQTGSGQIGLPGNTAIGGGGATMPPAGAAVPPAGPGAPKSGPEDKSKDAPKKPTTINAHAIAIDVNRCGEKNDLQNLVAEGNVHVHQDGETPKDKGVDIKGETLNLIHYPEGDTLQVFGDGRTEMGKYAQLQQNDLYLAGPKVTIKQKENTVKVDGTGVMTMPSNTTMDGTQPTKPGTLMTVHFNEEMLFDGRDADFSGGVVALQNESTMQCQNLTVELDKTISFKQSNQKGDQSAKAQRILAYLKVEVLDEVKDKVDKDKWTQKSRLLCQYLTVTDPSNEPNAPSVINARGPGSATILQYGTPEGFGADNDPKSASAAKQTTGAAKQTTGAAKQTTSAGTPQQLMRTHIDFELSMTSTQENDKTRKSKFLGNILVVYAPGDTFDAKVDISDPRKLPKGAMILNCNVLNVVGIEQFDPKTKQTKTVQIMTAEGRVECKTNDMMAIAERADFDQAKDIIIFTGSPNNPARVTQPGAPGAPPKTIPGQKILYDRSTGAATVTETGGISGELPPAERLQPTQEFLLARR